MKQLPISHIAPLHHEWTRGLEFYQIELDILQERLEEIAADNTVREAAEGVEHFQNQLVIHREYITGLRQRIRDNIRNMETEAENRAGHLQEHTVNDFEQLKEQYHTEERLVNDLRKEFNRFAAKWM